MMSNIGCAVSTGVSSSLFRVKGQTDALVLLCGDEKGMDRPARNGVMDMPLPNYRGWCHKGVSREMMLANGV